VEIRENCIDYKEVYLDRPFAYAIVDTENGVPVFIGTVNSVDGMAEQIEAHTADEETDEASTENDSNPAVSDETTEPAADFEPADSRFSFETKDIYGNTVNDDIFSQYDVTVVNVWGTFCYYCIVEMPELQEWYESMPSNVNIIGIVCDIQNENDSYYISEAQSIVKDTGVTYTNLIPRDGLSKLMNEVSAVPTTYFIDREGNVVGSTVYGADMDSYKREVEKLLK
jgi:thiol-disulfide isomerase/thioredoxin